jgi:glycosyltransferase involved in cell wall biosynthesis
MNYPKISIVTPSFNQGKYLEETICSVLEQKYPNLEYILVDGGSTDNSVEIIKKYEPHLSWWCSEKDNGHGHALNKGFKRCTGDIMAWINSDDKYFPWTLHTIAEIFMQHEDVHWIVGKNAWFDEKGRLLDARNLYRNKFDYLSGNYQWIQQESVFWRKEIWELCGSLIHEQYALMIDGDLWSRFFMHTDLWHINMVLAGYRGHATNRAIQQSDKVHAEISEIIHLMHHESSLRDRRIAKKIKLLRTSLHSLLNLKLKSLLITAYKIIYEISFSKKTKKSLSYKSLHCLNGNWVKTEIPFKIY